MTTPYTLILWLALTPTTTPASADRTFDARVTQQAAVPQGAPATAGKEPALADASPGAEDEDEPGLRPRFTHDVQLVSEFGHQGLRSGTFNPQNGIAALPSTQALFELRPDFALDYGRVSLTISPRAVVGRVLERSHGASGDDSIDDAFINRWRAKVQVAPQLSVAYGREVVQWGNSLFRSPSNPFFADNGRLHPIREIEGQEFVTATFTPSLSYAVSFLSNTGDGRRSSPDGEPFRRTDAVKVDFVGDAVNASVIASKRRGQSVRVGGSATYTASDAWLLYAEATAARGSLAWYPEPAAGPIGWQFARTRADSGRVHYTALLGASYTFRNGLAVTTEYLNNNEGYSDAQAGALASLGRSASEVLAGGGAGLAAAAGLLGRGLDVGLRLERRNYLFVQVLKTEYRNRADIAVSYAANLDGGGGGGASSYVTFNLTPRAQMFAIGTYSVGSADTEFTRLLRYTVSTGVRWFF